MDELIDIFDSNGIITGKTAMKSEAHRNGWFHQTVHIWFFTFDGQVLLQKRGKDKDIYPLLWDVSVAGHIGAGEEFEISAIREVKEEIGLKITIDQLEKIGVFKSIQKHHNKLIDCEFHHTYVCELKVSLENLQKQESEVEELKLVSIDQFYSDVSNNKELKTFVPYDSDYYKAILKVVKDRL